MATIAPRLRRPRLKLKAGIFETLVSAMIFIGVLALIVAGWLHRGDAWINPEHGIGYALGIIGGSMMLILLAYPIRKRLRGPRRAIGSVGFWFRFHMLLGLLGPCAILYHARFSWGALNSAVALGAMLIVAGSGLVGRFLYSRIHRGYSGRKLELRSLKDDMDGMLAELGRSADARESILARLRFFEERAVAAGGSFWSSAASVVSLGLQTRRAERQLRAELSAPGGQGSATRALLSDYFQAVRRAAEFAFYDRLLRLWHLLHLPLFILLVATAVLHIVAVHMY